MATEEIEQGWMDEIAELQSEIERLKVEVQNKTIMLEEISKAFELLRGSGIHMQNGAEVWISRIASVKNTENKEL